MSRRSMRMSASVVADVCVGRYGCLRRSVRMPALVGADGENKAKAEVNASAFVVLYRLLGWCAGCFPQISHFLLKVSVFREICGRIF